MDAAAMVSLARNWTTVPEQHICEIRSQDHNRYCVLIMYEYILECEVDACEVSRCLCNRCLPQAVFTLASAVQ